MTGLVTALLGLPRWLRTALGALAILAALWGTVSLYNGWVEARYRDKVEAQAAKARETAADERAADAIVNTRSEEKAHAAIDAAPTGAPIHPASRALACKRLHDLGRDTAACRSDSGN